MESETSIRMNLYRQLLPLASGREVELELKAPADRKAAGWCYKNRLGQLAIEIEPRLSPDIFLKVYLHEVAHARLDHPDAMKQYAADNPAIVNILEHQADELSGRWLAIARKGKIIPGWEIESQLITLINHFSRM